MLDNIDDLIDATMRVFCSASICFLAIPPQKNSSVNKYIFGINKGIQNVTAKKNVNFIPCTHLWYHVSKEGVVDEGILTDKVHLSEFGLRLLLQYVVSFFFGRSRQRLDSRLNDSRPKFQNQPLHQSDQNQHLHTSGENLSAFSKTKTQFKELPRIFTKLRSTCTHFWKRYSEKILNHNKE